MSEHIPGPWHWNESRTAIYNGTKNKDGKYTHCEQVFPPYNEDAKSKKGAEHNANLRLIAAAPDLLEQLEAFVDLANDWFSKMPEDWKARCICANEVIAKAKGA